MYQSLCASRLLYGASVWGPHAFRRVRTSPSLAVPLPLCVRPTPSTSRGSCGLLAAVVSPSSAVRSLVFAEASALPLPHSIFLHAFRYASSLSRLPPPVMHTLPGSGTVTCTSPRAAPLAFPASQCLLYSVPPRAAHLRPRRPCHPPARSVRLCASLLSPPLAPPGPGPFPLLPPSPSPSPSPASSPQPPPLPSVSMPPRSPVPQASPLSYPPGPPSHTRALRLLRTSCLPYQLYLPLPDRRCLACLARGFPDPALHFVRDCPVFYEVRGRFPCLFPAEGPVFSLASFLAFGDRGLCGLLRSSAPVPVLRLPGRPGPAAPPGVPAPPSMPSPRPPVVPLPFPPQPRPQPPPPPPIPP